MVLLKKFYSTLLITVVVLTTTICKAQGPPPMAMPTDNNKVLIDKLIEVTRYEAYFKNYCIKRINKTAQKDNWDEQKKDKIIQSINFSYFSSTIYNTLSFYEEKQLKEMIELFTKLNAQKKNQALFITDEMVESNLELFVESLLEGKYITKKEGKLL